MERENLDGTQLPEAERGGASQQRGRNSVELEECVEAVLETEIRPVLRRHGGEIILNHCTGGVVCVTLLGACAGCPSADLSTRKLIEETLKSALPRVERVEVEHPVDQALLDVARQILRREDAP